MKTICFVVQRYGKQILGGSEAYCRQIAERLTEWYKVEVLTSKALDYLTWENEIEEDTEELNGVIIHRFPTEHSRCLTQEIIDRAYGEEKTLDNGQEWLDAQGPYCPALVEYLQQHEAEYDAVVLMTYLYYPTVMAARVVGKKGILIPTAHDEPWIHQPIYDQLFAEAAAWYFLTPEEKAYVEQQFPTEGKLLGTGSGGVGVIVPDRIDQEAFRKKYHLGNKPYIVYAGRIDDSKFCPELFNYFRKYKTRHNNELQLVLCGKGNKIPAHADIHGLGFVSEEDKFSAMAGAVSLVLPSRFESLSIVVLEAMSMGTPVIVTEKCEVLKGHCLRSNAGLYYNNYLEFEGELDYLLTHEEERRRMGQNGVQYVNKFYQWSHIMQGLRDLIDKVIQND